MKDFLSEDEPPPYLRLADHDTEPYRIGPESTSRGLVENSEADVAGGSVLQRVTSFNILQRPVQSPRQQIEKEEENKKPLSQPEVYSEIMPSWRSKDKMKTVGVGLVLALNVGTEPPDVTKPHPCAMLQCWMDPSSISRSIAREKIGERLESQYAQWQQKRGARPMRYRRALDPTVEDVRALCVGLRRQARTDRVLLHYNGHGVPRPTENGEIWVFDKNHTQYIPLCVTDLRQWIGKPTIVVLDCSSAGILMPFLTAPLEFNDATPPQTPYPSSLPGDDMETDASRWIGDTLVLAPTSDKEWLPMHPDYPADIFTSCLTTPIKMALRWFVRRNPQSMGGLNPDAVDAIPGNATDRKTPLGDLNWIFTSVTDSIAWNILPKPLFQRLFRQDLLVASLFRNFLLADRILRSLNCTPQSFPPFPPGVCDHPLWQAWDLACETCLSGLIRDGILNNDVVEALQQDSEREAESVDVMNQSKPELVQKQTAAAVTYSSVTSPFFSEQLTSFEIWMEFASIRVARRLREPPDSPEQLPIMLQLLLSQAHRERALTSLCQFLDLGPWAVSLALSLGIFPYVMKLWLSQERKQYLVGIWARIIAFDSSCQVELVKDGALPHFVQHLTWGLNRASMNLQLNPVEASVQRIMAAFILSVIPFGYPQGQLACVRQNLHGTCCALLASTEAPPSGSLDRDLQKRLTLAHERVPPNFRLWLCLCLGNLFFENVTTQTEGLASGVHLRLFSSLNDDSSEVRTAACYAIGCLISLPAMHELPSVPMLPSVQQSFALLPPTSTISQGPHMSARQGLIPPYMSSQVNDFPGRLKPNFVHNEAGALPWSPQTMPGNDGFNPTEDFSQRLLTQSNQSGQHLSCSLPVSDVTGESSSQGRAVTNVQTRSSRPRTQSGEPLVPNRHAVFDDRRRLSLDLLIATSVLQQLNDANAMVRYEAVLVFARIVDKYLPAFMIMTEERTSVECDQDGWDELSNGLEKNSRTNLSPFPENVDQEAIDSFRTIWASLKMTQQLDAHPVVARAAHSLVSYVQAKTPRLGHSFSRRDKAIHEEPRSKSDHDLPRLLTKVVSPAKGETSLDSPGSRQVGSLPHPMSMLSISTVEQGLVVPTMMKQDFALPKSDFFEWKRENFCSSEQSKPQCDAGDPLSPTGALNAYLSNRNTAANDSCKLVAACYACLAPKPKSIAREALNKEILFEPDESAVSVAEEKLSRKKNSLELKQTGLLTNTYAGTSLLRFHPYEDILVVCDDQSRISVWDTKRLTKELSYCNGNPTGSRFTSTCWMNPESNSVLVTGCDDGSVRAWGGIPFHRGGAKTSSTLLSAFFAFPTNALPGKSGLILEWQQYSGMLFAAGNYSKVRIWDMNAEKCKHEISTGSDACISSLTTAWKSDLMQEGCSVRDSSWAGPNILVAGFSDGVVKVFDTRSHSVTDDSCASLSTSSRSRRHGTTTYQEHGSWVVDTAFIGYDNNYGIATGSVQGDVKIFDLRKSRSVQAYTAQRSPLTAMAVHSLIPLIATGSHAQFIKIMTLDGEPIQVIRHSQLNHGRMIGPIRCLAFHPRHAFLAAGGSDNLVHLFGPKTPLDLIGETFP